MVSDTNLYTQRPDDYEVISLYDLINILIRRKKQILLVLCISVLIAVVASFMMKPVYRISSVLSPGSLMDSSGKINYVESPQNMSSMISKGTFHSIVLDRLGLDPAIPGNNFQVNTEVPKNTTTVYLSIESGNTRKALLYMNALIQYLVEYYGERTRILTGKIKNDISVSKKKLEVLRKTEERLKTQLMEMQKNTEDIIKQRDVLLKTDIDNTDSLALLLYSNTIQQNVAYVDTLYHQIEENSMKQKSLFQNIDDLLLQLSSGGKSSGQQILEKGSFEGLVVVQNPFVNPQRVKPNRTLMVTLAGVLGLFGGIFIAFFREFWRNQKALREQPE